MSAYKKRSGHRCLPVIPTIVLLAIKSVGIAADAQPPSACVGSAQVRLSVDDAADFDRAMAALAAQAHIAICVEGKPLHATLSLEEKHTLAGFEAPIPLNDAIVHVASCYGYSVAKWESTYALSKRYDDPKDLPCATLEEMILSMDNELRILHAFDPKYENNSDIVRQIFAELTPDQIAQLPKATLTVGMLSADQRDLVQSAALKIYVGGRYNIARDVDYRLKHMPGATLGLVQQSEITPVGQAPGGGILIQLEGEKLTRQIGRSPMGKGDPAGEAAADTAAVAALTSEFDDILSHRAVALSPSHSMPELLAQLNAHGATVFSVAPELNSREVTVFGAANASATSVFRALAYACGLGLRTDLTGKQVMLVRPRAPVPVNIADLPRAARLALPDTFLRACGISEVLTSNTFAKLSPEPQVPVVVPESDAPPRTLPKVDTSPMDKPWLMQVAAARRLKAVLQLMLRSLPATAGKGQTPIAENALDEATRSALGALTLAEFVGSLDRNLPLKEMDFIANLDQDVLGGGIQTDSRGKRRLSIEFLVGQPGARGLVMRASIGGVLAQDSPPSTSTPTGAVK